MFKEYGLEDLKKINLNLKKWDIVFLYWDLASWKTTLSSILISKILWKNIKVKSPTYNYYNKYDFVYHFDLYRLNSYDEFFAVGGEDILDNKENISIIEWPELIKDYYNPKYEIYLERTNDENKRLIKIINF